MSDSTTSPVPARARRQALWALACLAPVPSLATYVALIGAPGALGGALFAVAKVWVLLLPWVWVRWVAALPARRAPQPRAWVPGLISGLVLGAAVWSGYLLLGDQLIDGHVVREVVARAGLHGMAALVLGAAYWTFLNSLLEEYVWRWFVGAQAEVLLGRTGGVVLAALLFSAHHFVAVAAYAPLGTAALASLGVFVAGAVWSWLYARTGSIWAAYLSHVLADVAVFAVAFSLLATSS